MEQRDLKECTFKPVLHPRSGGVSMVMSPSQVQGQTSSSFKGTANGLGNFLSDRSSLSNGGHKRYRSLSQDKKMNSSYSKFHEFKKNISTYQKEVHQFVSRSAQKSRRADSALKNDALSTKRGSITAFEGDKPYVNNDTIKISDMLTNLKKIR